MSTETSRKGSFYEKNTLHYAAEWKFVCNKQIQGWINFKWWDDCNVVDLSGWVKLKWIYRHFIEESKKAAESKAAGLAETYLKQYWATLAEPQGAKTGSSLRAQAAQVSWVSQGWLAPEQNSESLLTKSEVKTQCLECVYLWIVWPRKESHQMPLPSLEGTMAALIRHVREV